MPNFAPMQLQNYACGQWVAGTGKQTELTDAVTGKLVAITSSSGLDFGEMLNYARTVGGPPRLHLPIHPSERLPLAMIHGSDEERITFHLVDHAVRELRHHAIAETGTS